MLPVRAAHSRVRRLAPLSIRKSAQPPFTRNPAAILFLHGSRRRVCRRRSMRHFQCVTSHLHQHMLTFSPAAIHLFSTWTSERLRHVCVIHRLTLVRPVEDSRPYSHSTQLTTTTTLYRTLQIRGPNSRGRSEQRILRPCVWHLSSGENQRFLRLLATWSRSPLFTAADDK